MQQKPCTVRSPKWPDSLRLVSAYVYCIAVYKAYVVSRHFARTNTMKKKATERLSWCLELTVDSMHIVCSSTVCVFMRNSARKQKKVIHSSRGQQGSDKASV